MAESALATVSTDALVAELRRRAAACWISFMYIGANNALVERVEYKGTVAALRGLHACQEERLMKMATAGVDLWGRKHLPGPDGEVMIEGEA